MKSFIASLCVLGTAMSGFMYQGQGDIIIDNGENKDCSDKVAVHRYWSELRQNGLYTTSIEALQGTMWKESYNNEGAAFNVLSSDCLDAGSVSLFRCRDRDEVDSILTTSPLLNCSDSSGYAQKEQIGRCYLEKGDNDDLVALHRFYSAAITDHLYKTDKDAVDGYAYEGIECYVYSASAPLTVASTLKVTEQEPLPDLDLIFILDSSGSVASGDEDFSNWQAEIDFAAAAIRRFLDYNELFETRVGLINFSGCGASYDFDRCKAANKLKNELSLTSIEEALAHLDLMGVEDFNWGYTWTREALSLALTEFEANSSPYNEKLIVLLTDGEPYPIDAGHEPCKLSMNYRSETVAALKQMHVNIVTFGIGMDQWLMDEYFGCGLQYQTVDDFDSLADHLTDVEIAIYS